MMSMAAGLPVCAPSSNGERVDSSGPWGTLNAIDLNKGEIRWSIPFGEYPKLAAQGLTNTGTDNYGGPVVTANGLLFIGATTYDNKFHVYDKRTGKLLRETTLPAAGNRTPSLYMVNGREYVVIARGGGKNDAPSGGDVRGVCVAGERGGRRRGRARKR